MNVTGKDRFRSIRIRPRLQYFSGLPSLVPYLSVFFILMVFFMLGTNFVPLRGIPVELPQAEGELSYKAKALIVTIDRNAVIYFGDMIVSSKSELKSRVSDARSRRSAGNQREQLIVRADVNAPLQTIAVAFTVAQELNMDAILITRTEAPAGKTTIIEKD